MPLNPRQMRLASRGKHPVFDARLPQVVRGPAPADAARILSGIRLALAGCGSVGLGIVDRMARIGIAGLLCSDPSLFKTESLLTHPMITPSDVNQQNKAAFAARHAAKLNPAMDTRFSTTPLQDVPLADLRRCDLLVVATDNLESELDLAVVARRLGVPLVRAAVEGQTLTSQVSVFSNASYSSPCPGCLFGTGEWSQIGSGVQFSCSGEAATRQNPEPTFSLPHLCGLAADLCVQQIIRFVLGLGDPVADTMLTFCGYSNQVSVSRIRRSEFCPCDHRPHVRADVPQRLMESSPADILMAAEIAVGQGSIEIPGFQFVESLPCACTPSASSRRFVSVCAKMVRCPECRQVWPLPLDSFHASRGASLHQLGDIGMRTPLRQLGARSVRCVVATSDSRGAILFEEHPET
jgi:molybdopterin-synthase adenylyltransferase